MAPSRIQVLPPLVAERIAAGEVVERPASVVKELVENSIDAGATEIAIVLEDGGKKLIEVLDNGCGMGPADLELSIQRHATSKLREVSDLEKISTLGFRGEALPSIGAVATLTLTSRTADEGSTSGAFELTVEQPSRPVAPRKVTFGHFLGSAHGTRIRVEGLFSQIPARLKFLKAASAEVTQVREWIDRLALTHPEISFRLVSNDRTLLDYRATSESDRVRDVLGDGAEYPMVHRENLSEKSVRARLYWLQGLSTGQTKKMIQVVNGRAVRDRMLQQAILNPFRQALLPGQFPALAVYLEMDPSLLDVNVHPTKTELRFLNHREVFHSLQYVVETALAEEGTPSYVAPERSPSVSPLSSASPSPLSAAFGPTAALTAAAPGQQPRLWGAAEPVTVATPTTTSPLPLETPATHPLSGARYVGILFNTYIAFEQGGELCLVDQHAAHERVRFEKLRNQVLQNEGKFDLQTLLIPEAVKFAVERRPEMQTTLGFLESLGFDAELFGEDTVLFRAVPSAWGTDSLRTRLKNLVDRVLDEDFSTSGSSRLDETLFEKLASEACHSSVRAGDRLTAWEAESLVDDLFRCEHPWNCPHGRPTIARIPSLKLEEWFKRKVT